MDMNYDNENIPIQTVAAIIKAPLIAEAVDRLWPLLDKQKLADELGKQFVYSCQRTGRYGECDSAVFRAIETMALRYISQNAEGIMDQIKAIVESELPKLIQEASKNAVQAIGGEIWRDLNRYKDRK